MISRTLSTSSLRVTKCVFLGHPVVDDIKNIVDLELESDKAAEELATISDEHHVREAG